SMKRMIFLGSILGTIAAAFLMTTPRTKATAGCTQTGFFRDSINMTAAMINPTSVTGVVNATGCNIGVYYGPGSRGVIKNSEIYGANYFGVVANGDAGDVTLDVLTINIHAIGDSQHTGTQHGVG